MGGGQKYADEECYISEKSLAHFILTQMPLISWVGALKRGWLNHIHVCFNVEYGALATDYLYLGMSD
jgi:hypothetical protein